MGKNQHTPTSNEQYLQALIENSNELIQVLNPDGSFQYISPSVERLLGYTPAEVLNMVTFEFVHPDDLAKARWAFQRVVRKSPYGASRTLRIRHKNGQWRLFEGTARNLLDNPLVKGIVVNARDITEQTRAKQAIAASEKRLRLMVENLPAGAVHVDGHGIFINKTAEEITGYRREELPTLDVWFEKLYGERKEEIQTLYEKRKQAGFPNPRTVPIIRKDGQIRQVRFIVYAYEHGEVWLVSDVTESMQAESQLIASLQEKEVLLKEIHHRVKNNLQVIYSLLSLQAGYFSDKSVLEALRDSQHRIRSMALVHEKLYQSQDLAHINPAEYIRSLVTQLFNSYQNMATLVRFESDVDKSVMLNIDQAIPCGLIINELVTNSLKYAFSTAQHNGEGKITVAMKQQNDGQVILSVADNGTGLPEQIDFETATSLGLQLVNMLTLQLEGQLSVSRQGGTTVTVVFQVEE
ncbi:MAG: PAS domain S-box protein [Chloroflexi bacterium]|nr:MAG: PAS domain S-box protein [Chloroflexota bacterium]